MSKTNYKIIYDLDQDIWNWYYGASDLDNPDQLVGDDDRCIFKEIQGFEKIDQAKPILTPFLQAKIDDTNSNLNKFIKTTKSEFVEKFNYACDVLEKITKHPMALDEFTFFVTTYPRMTVFFEEGIIFIYAKIDDKLWGMPIDGFLHEGLHFQFNKYWRENSKSPVSKLSEDDYFIIKESLTVILDEELKPIITLQDCSYPEFADYREILHKHWKKHHNFDQLVDFGLEKLPEFINQQRIKK